MPPDTAPPAARSRLTETLITQLSIGPAFREVAASLLRQQLQERYPDLEIDPDIVMVGTPTWVIEEDLLIAKPPHYQALTDILARQAVLAVPALFIEGEHFLTQLPITEPAVHLAVRMEDIAHIINVLAPVMIRGYQQQQLAFWNEPQATSGPHWHELSNILRSLWNLDVVAGWSEEDRLMARELYLAPDLTDRKRDDRFDTHAYLVDIDQIDDHGNALHLNEHLVSVLIGKQLNREVILVHSMLQGFRKYATLEALGEDLPILLDTTIPHKKIHWRLVEPAGDFFDHLACALIAVQIEAIGSIDFSDLRGESANRLSLAAPPSTPAYGKSPGQDMQWMQQALPDWLLNASISDQNAYSRYMKDLSALHNFNQGQTYQDGIVPIEQYARDRLKAEMLKEHPDAANLALDQIELMVQSPVVWGLFTVPGQIDTSIYSLTELALQNLISVPLGIKTLRQRPPFTLPGWLTVDYLEALISRIDIGGTYPQLIKDTLLADPTESARRRSLYGQHLSIQLPLWALQCKMRHEAGIDERGYRYVTALMQAEAADRKVDGQPIVIRPLAFVPTRRGDATPDVVANMFVIGPQNPAAGPCLLYRPLLDPPLTQYASPTNLLYIIQQSASLRDSVLAWLPDDARHDYSQYVFPGGTPSPWTLVEFVADPVKLWALNGPLKLGEESVTGDLFAALFNANANALVTLADRRTVSNAEARWATFKRAGWAIFNGALPFLGRTVGAAAWIWQIMDQLQGLAEASTHPEHQSPWVALTDLLLNLGMAIALHSAARTAPRSETEPLTRPPGPALQPAKPDPLVISRLPTVTADELPSDHAQPLHISGAVSRTPSQLGAVLDRFKVAKPDGLGEAISREGPHRHLYQSGQKYYALVGSRWFEVQLDADDSVLIVDPDQPQRTGPPLIKNQQGTWFVDTRLRLRGGGPKALIKKARTLSQKRAEELRKQLSEFEKQKQTVQSQLQHARQAMEAGPSTSSQAAAEASRQTYLQTLENQCSQYESALQKLKELAVHAPTPDYPQKALSYVKAQTELTNAGIRESMIRFTPKLRDVLDKIEHQAEAPQERYINEARQMTELSGEMLKHLDYMQTRFNELQKLAKAGSQLIRTTKGTLPIFDSTDLKTLRVTMTRNLCLPANTTSTAPHAWYVIDQIVDTADLAIQCLRDTLHEQSEPRLDERIDTLSSLIEQFQMLDERLEDFPAQFPEHALQDNIQALREHLREFQRDTFKNLSLLCADRQILRNRPTPPSTPPKSKKKFIRTRYNGLLIGDPRITSLGMETGLVDIRSPLTQKVVATYHEKSPGVWVERLQTPPQTPTPPSVDLPARVNEGQALLDQLPAFLARATRHATTELRTPSGIEYLYHQHIRLLEQASHAIEDALSRSNSTGNDAVPAITVKKALDTAVTDLYQQSNQHMLRALKECPPTITGIEWLKHHDAITIKKTINRRRLRSARPDYLDEYTISDRQTQQVLWYAHFHYSTTWTPAKAFLSARLKSVAEHRRGSAADSLKGLGESERTAFLRSEISLEQARQLFFERPKSESGH